MPTIGNCHEMSWIMIMNSKSTIINHYFMEWHFRFHCSNGLKKGCLILSGTSKHLSWTICIPPWEISTVRQCGMIFHEIAWYYFPLNPSRRSRRSSHSFIARVESLNVFELICKCGRMIRVTWSSPVLYDFPWLCVFRPTFFCYFIHSIFVG